MKIKRFFAADMRSAIRQVRDAQGPDAVILSTRSVEGGIEIISAIDFDENLVAEIAAREPQQEPSPAPPEPLQDTPELFESWDDDEDIALDADAVADEEEAPARDGESGNIVWTQDPAISQLQRELKNVKTLLQDQLSQLAWNDFSRREPLRAQLLGRLLKLGLDVSLARRIAHGVNQFDNPDKAWREALLMLVRTLRTGDNELLDHGGVVALVGATGVGKTTTAAKIAARYAMHHGPSQVALVTTDAYRIGAQKQLLTYGRILNVPVHVVTNEDDMTETLSRLHDRGLVLIDTAGMSQRDLRLSDQFSRLRCLGDVQPYLVASANTQRAVLDDVVRAFEGIRLTGCILTKVDEAVSLGDALSVMIRYELPVAYVTDGQQVPEDLHEARSHRLVSAAVALARRFSNSSQGEGSLAAVNSKGGVGHA